MSLRARRLLPALLAVAAVAPAALAVDFTGSYSQNFDSMGTGTAAPAGWSYFDIAGSHSDYTTTIPASAVAGGVANATLIATTSFSGTKSGTQAYNFATTADPTNRSLGTSPTGNALSILQLSLTNTTGLDLSSINVGYDIRRFAAASALEDMPGYRLFFSLDNGATWANVAALNPVFSGSGADVVVPNTVGVTTVPSTTIALGGSWANNANLLLRFVDDNAVAPSPDQIIGLDNVTVSVVPAPGAAVLLGLGSLLAARRRR